MKMVKPLHMLPERLKYSNTFFVNIATDIGINDDVVSASDAITMHDQHVISMCCTKAARQLNALARISKYLDCKSKTIIYNSFILSNFNYCQLAWHFCGKTSNQKLEKLQERSLRILYCDYISHFQGLLENTSSELFLTTRIKCILVEVFK